MYLLSKWSTCLVQITKTAAVKHPERRKAWHTDRVQPVRTCIPSVSGSAVCHQGRPAGWQTALRKVQQTGSQSGKHFWLETAVMSALHNKLWILAKYLLLKTIISCYNHHRLKAFLLHWSYTWLICGFYFRGSYGFLFCQISMELNWCHKSGLKIFFQLG